MDGSDGNAKGCNDAASTEADTNASPITLELLHAYNREIYLPPEELSLNESR
jgi:hypothetical protein